jgi:hypothetical protein
LELIRLNAPLTAAEIDADPTIFKPRPNSDAMNRRIARQLGWKNYRAASRIRELRIWANDLVAVAEKETD